MAEARRASASVSFHALNWLAVAARSADRMADKTKGAGNPAVVPPASDATFAFPMLTLRPASEHERLNGMGRTAGFGGLAIQP